MRKFIVAALACVALVLVAPPAQSDVIDYVTASSEIYTSTGDAAKATGCPDGHSVISGGFRFTPEDGTGPTSLMVMRDEPWTTAPDMPGTWRVDVVANESGTLRVTVVCAID